MDPETNRAVQPEEGHGSLLILALLAPVVGVAAGVLGAVFRLALDQADGFRDTLIARAHDAGFAGFLLVTAAVPAPSPLRHGLSAASLPLLREAAFHMSRPC